VALGRDIDRSVLVVAARQHGAILEAGTDSLMFA